MTFKKILRILNTYDFLYLETYFQLKLKNKE